MPQGRVLLRPTRRRPRRRRRGRRNSAPSRCDALPRQQALRGRVILHMHLIQTLDAPRPVVAPQARVRAAPRPAVEARVVVGRAATRVRRFTRQTVRGAPLREMLEDQAAAGAVRLGSRPPFYHFRMGLEHACRPDVPTRRFVTISAHLRITGRLSVRTTVPRGLGLACLVLAPVRH